ncbi:MAG: DUF1858 domain-containing protein [Clostridia bacterium]|nr:DUF1858 domain-containing protein [Clostridia bacterium]
MYIDVDENSIIGDVIAADKGTIQIFYEFGMECLGCSHARHESIADACETHGVNTDELVHQLIEYFAEKENY